MNDDQEVYNSRTPLAASFPSTTTTTAGGPASLPPTDAALSAPSQLADFLDPTHSSGTASYPASGFMHQDASLPHSMADPFDPYSASPSILHQHSPVPPIVATTLSSSLLQGPPSTHTSPIETAAAQFLPLPSGQSQPYSSPDPSESYQSAPAAAPHHPFYHAPTFSTEHPHHAHLTLHGSHPASLSPGNPIAPSFQRSYSDNSVNLNYGASMGGMEGTTLGSRPGDRYEARTPTGAFFFSSRQYPTRQPASY